MTTLPVSDPQDCLDLVELFVPPIRIDKFVVSWGAGGGQFRVHVVKFVYRA